MFAPCNVCTTNSTMDMPWFRYEPRPLMKNHNNFENLFPKSYRTQAAPASEPNFRTRKAKLKIRGANLLPRTSWIRYTAPRRRMLRTMDYESGRERAASGPRQGRTMFNKVAAASIVCQNYSFSKFPHHAFFVHELNFGQALAPI